jgi:acyl-CoA synthetase (AMP-forming)/AMP-acid ligase II
MAVDITEHEGIACWQDDLLPRIVDRLGNERPHGVYSMWATPGGKGLRTITYHELANAVNGLAGWLVARLGPGRGGVDPEVLTYIGSNDVRYVVLLLAAIKAGYVVFLTSPRNSPTAHRSLFEQLRCQTLLTSDPVPPHALAVINEVKPRHLTVPSVDELLEKEYPPLVSDKTFQEARWEPLMIM